MTPQERMALALAYQQRKPDLGDLSPEQVTAMQAPTQQPTMSFLDRLSENGAGLGKGLANQVEGMGQMVTHPIETGKEMYRNVSDIVSNPSLIADALKQMGEKAASSPAGFGEVVGENINPRNLLKTLAKGLAKPVMQELIVAHGTPHRFPPTANNPLGEFDASKIGTGEGAQAYGHGIYLAESPNVASDYRKTLSKNNSKAAITQYYGGAELPPFAESWQKQDPTNFAIRALANVRAGLSNDQKSSQVIKEVRRLFPDAPLEFEDLIDDAARKTMANAVENRVGSLYTVDLPDEKIAQMLDWDKPLSKQSDTVKNALRKNGVTAYVDEMEASYLDKLPPKAKELAQKMIHGPDEMVISNGKGIKNNDIATNNWVKLEKLAPGIDHNEIHNIRDWYESKNGADLYTEFSQGVDKSANVASERLRQMGIPGIKYLDAGSRDAKKGTRNFVVFPGEEKHLKILERK
jgi:hypothetical protein